MSTMKPDEMNDDLDGPARYAPKGWREARSEQAFSDHLRLPRAPQLQAPQDPARSLRELEALERRLGHPASRALEPQPVPNPEQPGGRAGLLTNFGRFGLIVAAAAAGALLLIALPFGSTTRDQAGGDSRVANSGATRSASSVDQGATAPAKLPGKVGDARTTAAKGAAAGGAGLVVADAPPADARPHDGPAPADAQQRRPAQSPPAWPTAPGSEAAASSPQTASQPPPQPSPPAAPQATPGPAPGSRALAPEEVDALVRRAQAFIGQGDISAARAVLKRAVDAGDARAALALGATYDPNELKQMGAVGIKSDIAQARAWYMKAAEYGSAEAPKRIALLPQR
jgi:hypothetical protein